MIEELETESADSETLDDQLQADPATHNDQNGNVLVGLEDQTAATDDSGHIQSKSNVGSEGRC